MRLHSLEVTAFGPFAETVAVDFDRLSAAGLFLLSGPTGAGKTSVLDAVCFALYGDVPGDRSTAKRLRCDQAAPDAAPRVVLEATLAGRRFRISRSPAWERPKKRGEGTTTQQASVVLQERRGDSWTTLSTRLDETGHLLSDLLGMTLTQFTQVALLPQGRFQAFLRAKSEERKELLQRLFRTERFTDVERWLRDRRIQLRRHSDAVHQLVAGTVSRISEVTAEPLPAEWDIHDLSLPAGAGEITAWVTELTRAARAGQEQAAAVTAEAVEAEAQARAALEAGRAVVERHERVAAAAAEQADLVAASEEHELAVVAVEAARRAAGVVPVHQIAERARADLARARSAVGTQPDQDVDFIHRIAAAQAELTDLADRVASVRALLPRQDRLAVVARELTALAEARATLAEQTAEVKRRWTALPVELTGLREALAEAREAQAAVPELQARVDAAALVDELLVQLAEARARHTEAREAALTLRERALDVRQARLEGMAAELAGALAVGASCPVCGSADHPHKATAADDAPDAEAERAAQRAADDASATEHARESHVRDLTTRIEIARQRLGPTGDASTLEEDLDRVSAVADRSSSLEQAVTAVEREYDELGVRLAAAETRGAELEASVRHFTAERDRLALEVAEALEGTGAPDVPTLVDRLESELHTTRETLQRWQELHRAQSAADDAEEAVVAAYESAGFDSAQEAVEAALPSEIVDEMDAKIKHHDRRLAAVQEILSAPDAEEVIAGELPDLEALVGSHRTALAALGSAQGAVDAAVNRLARITALAGELTDHLQTWHPLRDDLELTARMAAFVEGKSSDNRLQMSLSAYVVAYRLTQVVAAANERLAAMSDQRYSLEHSATRGAGDRRGGLALVVRDDWSGEPRDPATLSGGETFVVSLALALGLADVIMQEAGGTLLETLFVDEGFGSLDADTLDDVLDVLDGLRDGGRVVGVVSHVAEMRDRIPAQLIVTKQRTGSRLRVQGAPA